MKPAARRGGVPPGVAVALLVGSALVAGWSLFGGGDGATNGGSAASMGDEVPLEVQGGEAVAAAVEGVDLLARHGSYDGATPVRLAFGVPNDPAPVAAAPLAEVQSPASSSWRGDDPPALQLGVLLIGGATRRAVVDGNVLGVGDRWRDTRVVAIETDVLTVDWRGRSLTYELGAEWPREFRGELARRSERAAQADAAETAAPVETGASPNKTQKEKTK